MTQNGNGDQEAVSSELAAPSCSVFLARMHPNHRRYFYTIYPSWNWRTREVLITLWIRTRLVKIYYDEGRQIERHPAETKRSCRSSSRLICRMVPRSSDRLIQSQSRPSPQNILSGCDQPLSQISRNVTPPLRLRMQRPR